MLSCYVPRIAYIGYRLHLVSPTRLACYMPSVLRMMHVLHVWIIGPAGTFRDDPVDILGRILNVARFTVYTVLRIDLKTFYMIFILDDLRHACRAVTLRGLVIKWKIMLKGGIGIRQLKVAGLVFLMVGV